MSDEVLQQLAEEARGLREAVSAGHNSGNSNSGTANIIFNAGGWAALLAGAVAIVCLTLQIQSQFQQQKTDTEQDADIRELRAEQRRDDDYSSLLYRNYPELRPEILKKIEAEKK